VPHAGQADNAYQVVILVASSSVDAAAAATAAAAAVFAVQDHASVPKNGAADLLQLALNCSNTTTAEAAIRHLPLTAAFAARRMPELLEPDVARRLLGTAATRQHAAAIHQMVTHQQLEYMTQHIDAATLEVITLDLRDYDNIAYLRLLTQLPAAAHLSSEAVIRLLLSTAARYRTGAVPAASSTAV
jgi:hypothetical protein